MKVLVYTVRGITSAHIIESEEQVLPYLFRLLANDCSYDILMTDMHCILSDNDISFKILDPIGYVCPITNEYTPYTKEEK